MIKTLGIMQPYFFPYLGYFQLIALVEQGILFDIVKYKRKSWMNRNRMLDNKGGWHYITVPVKSSDGMLIKDAMVIDHAGSLRHIRGQLEHYRGKAPFFKQTLQLIDLTFNSTRSASIGDLSASSLKVVCDYLGMAFNWTVCSDMHLELPPIEHAGQWALEISSLMGARRYINAPGGREILIPREWHEREIDLRFLQPSVFRYPTGPYTFVENLSILDVLMWNEPRAIMEYIRCNTECVV
ncbi:WbqC family protein [Pseudomonas cichorii]|uniref:WbqC family protein n=1 Tax=Pseudomonas cichorii TaxID=36746 RepID=UPI001C89E880|nr:WbqC family protein [Pseudomonas cichorii]MBX8483722.1 WbqC family protein [Pseudomonas cichorii]MBX8588977.1 WbqC family protein [Pseudomonas cichorii]